MLHFEYFIYIYIYREREREIDIDIDILKNRENTCKAYPYILVLANLKLGIC